LYENLPYNIIYTNTPIVHALTIGLGKMAKNTGRPKKFLQAIRWGSMHLGNPSLGVLDFLLFLMCSHQVLTVFISSSKGVPNIFPKFPMHCLICSP
jgi:hypothetical protein